MRQFAVSIVVASFGLGCGGGGGDAGDVPTGDASSLDARDSGLPDVPRFDAPIDIVTMDRPPTCGVLSATYSYGYAGGIAPSTDSSQLTPTNGWHRYRTTDDATISCAVAIPACTADAGITMQSVVDALGSPDVTSALATPGVPFYGYDPRAFDGQIWSFRRGDGRGFDVGDPCRSGDACPPIPDGIAVLEGVLTALDSQQLSDPSCAALR